MRPWALLALSWLGSAAADCTGLSGGQVQTVAWFLENCANPAIYDRDSLPTAEAGTPTKVEVQLHMTQLGDVNEKGGHVTVGGFLLMRWLDPRLSYNASSFPGGVNLWGFDAGGLLWTADVHANNLVDSSSALDSFEISADGLVQRSRQVRWKLRCPMRFGKLPFDDQVCQAVMVSFAHNNSELRVLPYGGVEGPGASGTGIVADAIYSGAWAVGSDGEGFQTPGRVEVRRSGWDYLWLEFSYSRRAAYYIRQVMLPDTLFLGISYTAFYVDPQSAPTRAALAVIPLLIMITLLNNVYKALPMTSENMWLTDTLLLSLLLCSAAALEFAFVQLLLTVEKKRASNLQQLHAVRNDALKLISSSKEKRMSVIDLMRLYKVAEVEEGPEHLKKLRKRRGLFGGAKADEGPQGRRRSEAAEEARITEATMGVIEYARDIFEHYDRDESQCLSAREISKVMSYFNVYLSTKTASLVICMFLRDKGEKTPRKEASVQMEFRLFLEFLLEIKKYLLRISSLPWLERQRSKAPTKRLDMMFRLVFLVLIVLKLVIMVALIPLY